MSGLYIHIPFCRQACNYCNFHFSTQLKYEDDLVSAILVELRKRKDYLSRSMPLQSIYFGGGTPSIISISNLKKIFESIRLHFQIHDDCEITFEANPEDINKQKLSSWIDLGVNRLSIGVQSFVDSELKWMNRIHNSTDTHNALDLVNNEDLSYSLDLIFGIPGSTKESYQKNIEKALKLKPDHISAYALTVEEGTLLAHQIHKNISQQPNDLESKAQFYLSHDIFTANGYEHYEISNYARDSKYAVHNSNYWKGVHYLGIGPSAHSYNGESRSWNVANNAKYISIINEGLDVNTTEALTTEDQFNEKIMVGLRTKWGINLPELTSKFPPKFIAALINNLEEKVNDGWIIKDKDNYTLSKEALILADGIASDMFIV